ncbi:MAG: hypothetical protein KA126_06765 [Candidatus Hydrothermae bacterium]|nr:hypothetical protein [Candidatus Hydrothermae bacterium]
MWLKISGFATQIPTFLLVTFAGVAVERYNRYRILFVTKSIATAQALLLCILYSTWKGRP